MLCCKTHFPSSLSCQNTIRDYSLGCNRPVRVFTLFAVTRATQLCSPKERLGVVLVLTHARHRHTVQPESVPCSSVRATGAALVRFTNGQAKSERSSRCATTCAH